MKKTLIFLVACSIVIGCTNSNSSKKNNEGIVASVEEVEIPSAEEVYSQNISKVALILSYQKGIPFSQGSGFFIEKNTLITNYHCVAGSDRIEFKITGDDNVYKGTLIKASDEYDLAIISTQQDFQCVKVDSLGTENIGSKVYAIGNPRGLEGTISDGILSGKREEDGIEYLQITAPISPGNSGGPILNEKGDVIGVATFTYKNSQNLNFGMPIKYIDKCIDYTPAMSNKIIKKVGTNSEAITMTYFEKEGSEFTEFITLKNNTDNYITSVTGVIVYKTMDGEILDFKTFSRKEDIPVGLAKRLEFRSFDQSQNWVYYKSKDYLSYFYKKFKVEFRLLSYEIEE